MTSYKTSNFLFIPGSISRLRNIRLSITTVLFTVMLTGWHSTSYAQITSSGKSGVIFGTGPNETITVTANDFGMNGYLHFMTNQTGSTTPGQEINFGFTKTDKTLNKVFGITKDAVDLNGVPLKLEWRDPGNSFGDSHNEGKIYGKDELLIIESSKIAYFADGNGQPKKGAENGHIQFIAKSVGIGKAPDGKYSLDVDGTLNAKEILIDGKPFTSTDTGTEVAVWETPKTNETDLVVNGRSLFGIGRVGENNVVMFYDPNGNSNKRQADGAIAISEKIAKNYSFLFGAPALFTDVALAPTAAWGDYVFEEDYKLKDLSEVEAYIKQNKHLPNIPSQSEIRENGYSFHDMNVRMIEKIEELTLYVIEQQKHIKALEQKLAERKE